ncbi:MAG: mycofactocin biosynthesis glycosyltransferase MftF [Actinomycetota bacterium]
MTGPAQLELTLDAETRRSADGRLLIGGSPFRIVRLSATGGRLLDRWLAGEPVPETGPAAGLARRLVRAGVAHPLWSTAEHAVDDVTIVIPVRDDPDGLAETLTSLGEPGPVVVVDDGSDDADAVRSAADRTGATVLRRDRSGGPGVAREHGRTIVETPFVAFVDAGCRPEPGWLDGLLCHFVDPDVVAVAPRIRSVPGPTTLERYEVDGSPLDLGGRPAPVRPGSSVSYVPTAALVARADAPAFDPALRFGEDVDLIWRIVAGGGEVRYEPSVTVWHRPRRSWRAWAEQRRSYGSSAGPLSTRHGAAVVPFVAPAISTTAWLLALAKRPGLAAVTAVGGMVAGLLKLHRSGVQPRVAVEVVATSQVRIVHAIARSTRRTWWPFALVALGRRGLRWRLLLALLAPVLAETRRARPEVGVARSTVATIADDLAYGVGVWEGCIAAKTVRPLVPHLSLPEVPDAWRSNRAT